ncbi:MAG TPA: 2-dehydropantoate 2-reductase [Terriglobales bacterium]|nr:2-dehydropantoate 2-reductase [Terriglobales bacterium]
MPLKICIVGCGALGSVIAGHLAGLAEVEVYAYDTFAEHMLAIREHGLKISGTADFTVNLHATVNPLEIPLCDFGIFATKSIHTRAAITQTAHIFGLSSAVCSVQNGLGNEEIIAERVKYVIRGAAGFGVHMRGPGHAAVEFYGDLWIGPFEPSGTPYSLVEQLAQIMNRAGLRFVAMRDARGAQWTKLIFNSAANSISALTRLHLRAGAQFAPTAALYEDVLKEGEAVARALGITLQGDPRAIIAEGVKAPTKRNASMLVDVLTQRPTEVDFINGAIADQGEMLGVPVPLNRTIWQLLKGLEHSWGDPF